MKKRNDNEKRNILSLHAYKMCFIPKDEVELQQDDENLPYEEEIYKDSSTFLKVTNSCFSVLSLVLLRSIGFAYEVN